MTQKASVDRRQLLGGSALTMLGMTGAALAQSKDEPKAKGKGKAGEANAVRVSQASRIS